MECEEAKCGKCQRPHNTLLHFERKMTALLGSAVRNENFEHLFLGTAIIYVMDNNGIPMKMRALLDSGAQVNVISEKMFNKSGLSSTPTKMEIVGLGEVVTESHKRSQINIASINANNKTELDVFIMKQVTSCQPANLVDISKWKIPKDIQLEDNNFDVPAKIDILIGGELFYRLTGT